MVVFANLMVVVNVVNAIIGALLDRDAVSVVVTVVVNDVVGVIFLRTSFSLSFLSSLPLYL